MATLRLFAVATGQAPLPRQIKTRILMINSVAAGMVGAEKDPLHSSFPKKLGNEKSLEAVRK
jgi:hypothetical protein